jgi:glycosyltransferase involved in cell wall biosynthesis
MKILYIGHYKENSGWSQAAIDYILALDSLGLDIVCKNIKLTNSNPTLPERILELESKSTRGVDYCIQHVLPHHLVATTKFKKNISYFVGETNTIKHLLWFENLKNMDEVWVPNNEYKNNLHKDGLSNVKCIPHAFNTNKYKVTYPEINFEEYNSTFKFYTISELSDRKNIDSILRCYYSEFSRADNVVLILKIKKNGVSSEALHSHVKKKIENIKNTLRMNKELSDYPPEIIINVDIPEEKIYSLHQSCNCFVGISHGEAWSIPSFEAMCFGKTPICSKTGGPADFIDYSNISTGILIDGVYNVCNHSDPAFLDLFSGREEWFCPSENLTKRAMRLAYEKSNTIDRSAGLQRGELYNYNNIATLIRENLND